MRKWHSILYTPCPIKRIFEKAIESKRSFLKKLPPYGKLTDPQAGLLRDLR